MAWSATTRVVWAALPIAATAAVLAVLPPLWLEHATYDRGLAVDALVFAAYAVGFNLMFGSTNQLFLCVGALAGVGGYGTAVLSDSASFPLAAAAAAGTASAAIVGALLSWIAVRRSLDVIFTGIVTLVFALSFESLLVGKRDLTGGDTGHILKTAAVGLADDRIGGYWLFAGVVVGFLIVFRVLQLSHVGWAFRALRDGETAAELAGVDVARYRVYAATVGSAMIGLAGALDAYSAGFISPSTYGFSRVDVRVLVIVAVGGLGLVLSPVLGAAAFAFFDQAVTSSGQLRELFYGAFIVAIFLVFRRGALGALDGVFRQLASRRDRGVEQPPGRAGIHRTGH